MGKTFKPVVAMIAVVMVICSGMLVNRAIGRSTGDSRERAELEHGVKLPRSATSIQCRGDGWLRVTPVSGGGVTTLFEMQADEIPAFLAPLKIRSRAAPVVATGDPMENGYNVWSHKSTTWVPGNKQYGGFQKTWEGAAVPLEMVSCDSPEGWFLHLEFWSLENGKILTKMCTMWQD